MGMPPFITHMLSRAGWHLPPRIVFAFPMKCVLDVTINILQTPYRALVSDLATKEQQLPLQARKRSEEFEHVCFFFCVLKQPLVPCVDFDDFIVSLVKMFFALERRGFIQYNISYTFIHFQYFSVIFSSFLGGYIHCASLRYMAHFNSVLFA